MPGAANLGVQRHNDVLRREGGARTVRREAAAFLTFMSYDLTIRSDESFSEFKPVAPLAAFLGAQPKVKPNGDCGFAFEDGEQWMEINMETVNEEGKTIGAESNGAETFNCIRAHIPNACVGREPERDYFPLLRSIAEEIGWSVYDEQSEEELT